MQINPKKLTKWSGTTAILCCLLNTHFFAPNLLAQSAKAATGEQSEIRLVDFQFGGSLCLVCLNAFKSRLLNMPGVKNVEISVDKINPKSGHPPKVAHAFVGYDPEQISKENLIEIIRRNDFKFLAAKEKVNNTEESNLKQ